MNITKGDFYRCISPDAPMFGDLVLVRDIFVVSGDPARDIVHFRVLTNTFGGEMFETETATFSRDFVSSHNSPPETRNLKYWRPSERPRG